MDLWIRSQDRKRLIPKPNLYVVYSEGSKCTYIGDSMIGHIAKYETEERAIEVLDEIQNILKPRFILNPKSIKEDGNSWVENGVIMQKYNADVKFEHFDYYVYEMPKE